MGVDAMMLVKTKKQHTEREVLRLATRLYEAFGSVLWVDRGTRHCLSIVPKCLQDGETIKPRPGEQFIQVHLFGRYYGRGYERGPLHDYIAVAMWLEHNIPGCAVYYGSDSSGICAEPFGPEQRADLFRHFAEHGHIPYTGAFTRDDDDPVRHCDFCDIDMVRHGWGASYAAYSCHGCGFEEKTRDNGATWTDKTHR